MPVFFRDLVSLLSYREFSLAEYCYILVKIVFFVFFLNKSHRFEATILVRNIKTDVSENVYHCFNQPYKCKVETC